MSVWGWGVEVGVLYFVGVFFFVFYFCNFYVFIFRLDICYFVVCYFNFSFDYVLDIILSVNCIVF